VAEEASWKNGPRLATLKSCRTLNSRDPQAPTLTVLGSQGRLSTATELMDWVTTPVLKAALMPIGLPRMDTVVSARMGPPWH